MFQFHFMKQLHVLVQDQLLQYTILYSIWDTLGQEGSGCYFMCRESVYSGATHTSVEQSTLKLHNVHMEGRVCMTAATPLQ